jgi:hypothetical protein
VIRKNKTVLLIICILAFAVGAYLLFFKKAGISSGREGLSRFSVQTFKKESGWGYRIYQDTTAVIQQQFIPGVPGTKGFDTEKAAHQTGDLVIRKLNQGIFPPTIAPAELDSMNIKY